MSLGRLAGPTVFLGAFLLFAFQPLAAKRLLPVYGGSSSVWTVCLLFFQAALLGGYAWAHLLRSRPKLHALLLLAAAALVRSVESVWTMEGVAPATSALFSLAASAGLPYFALSATSPLLQAWTKDYKLYARSNLGSLLGLVGFVFVLDRLESATQIIEGLFLVFAAMMAAVCVGIRPQDEPAAAAESDMIRPFNAVMWLILAMCGTGLLAATTNQLCQEVAPIPLLWVWPLGLYLASFVLCFENPRWYKRIWFGRLAALLIPAACMITPMGTEAPYWAHLVIDSAALFVCLMLCHGELAARRPGEGSLTLFYLAVAGGGVLGSLLVAIVAPLVFTSYLEFPLLLMLTGCVVVALWWRDGTATNRLLFPMALGSLAPLALLWSPQGTIVAEMRNFYGIVRVTLGLDGRGQKFSMTHGQTLHGTEYISEKAHPRPSTYYTAQSGVGLAISEHRRGPMEVGVVGLGAGTLASYARPGDHWRFFEINPDVIRLAREPFTYLRTAAGTVDVIEGDGRLSLARESPGLQFDVLVVDAFSSDSVPVHLLTGECAALYQSRLRGDGILAVHISNRTLDLEPVVRGMAKSIGFDAIRINNASDSVNGVSGASWMLLSGQAEVLDGLRKSATTLEARPPIVWRDGHADVLGVLAMGR